MGGILAGILALTLVDADQHDITVKPIISEKSFPDRKTFGAMISELSGTFVLVFLFMICTDKKT